MISIVISKYYRERISFVCRYNLFNIDYDLSVSNFRDRSDSLISGYIFYQFWAKTSLFIEYENVDIKYNSDYTRNSVEKYFYSGLRWNYSEKSGGNIKIGFTEKDFELESKEGGLDFVFELQADHSFTEKTSMGIIAYRKNNESDVLNADYFLTNYISLDYNQKVTGKITFSGRLSYSEDSYNGGTESGRVDRNSGVSLTCSYDFTKWFKGSLGYIFANEDSTVSSGDYTSNTLIFKINTYL